MAPHLVAYTYTNKDGYGRLGSTVLDLPSGQFRLSVDRDLRITLRAEHDVTDLGILSLDELPGQAEHPAYGAPYPYKVSGFYQSERPHSRQPWVAFAYIALLHAPVVTLAGLRAAEAAMKPEKGYMIVTQRLIPMASFTEAELAEV